VEIINIRSQTTTEQFLH